MSILRMSLVKSETGHASHASIYTAIHAGLFTVPVQIGERSVGWPDAEVKAINSARVAGKSTEQIRELVAKLHEARMSGTGESFKTDWFERSALKKKKAVAKPSSRTSTVKG